MRSETLTQKMQECGARWNDDQSLALDFGDAAAEARAAFESGGVYDGHGRAKIWLSGKDRVDFLNGQCTNDIKSVSDQHSRIAILVTAKGKVIDRVQAFAQGDRLGFVGSAGQQDALRELLAAKIVMEDCEVTDASDLGSLLAFGPAAEDAAKKVLGACPGTSGDGFEATSVEVGGHSITACATRAPGGHGVEILGAPDAMTEVYAQLLDAGLKPIGETAFDQIRVEAGLPALGREMGDHVNPLECGLEDSVSFTKGCYVGQEVIARLHNYKKVKRQLCGLQFPEAADPDALDGEIFWDLLRVGQATSVVRSPRLGATLALGLIKVEYAKPGTDVYGVLDGEKIEGKVVELPFG